MVKLRAEEVARAVSRLHLDVQITLGNLPEGAWHAGDFKALITEQLRGLRPTIIYAPSCVDFHPEHLKVAGYLAQVMAEEDSGTVTRVRVYELQVPLSVGLINRQVNVQRGLRSKRAALAEYLTQRESFAWHRRQERYLKVLLGSGAATEVFCEMTTRAYIRMMEQSGVAPPYRSLRHRPFTDVLAWVLGTRSRQRIRTIIDQ
jgi:hypothetical protein